MKLLIAIIALLFIFLTPGIPAEATSALQAGPEGEKSSYAYWLISANVRGTLKIDHKKEMTLEAGEAARVGLSKGKHNLTFIAHGDFTVTEKIRVDNRIESEYFLDIKKKATETLETELNTPYHIWANWNKIKSAVKAGADLSTRGTRRWTVLLRAAHERQFDAIKLLLDTGVSVNETDGSGLTPLMFSAYMGHVEAVKLLLDRGADVNAKTNKSHYLGGGTTALLEAAKQPHKQTETQSYLEVVNLLMAKGAEINVRDLSGTTALTDAKTEKMKQLLLSYGAKE